MEEKERTAGIGFAVSNLLATQGISPTPISDRLMSMRIQLKGGDNLTFISVYPPAIQRPQEEKEQFYECVSAAEMDSVIIFLVTLTLVWLRTGNHGRMSSGSMVLER